MLILLEIQVYNSPLCLLIILICIYNCGNDLIVCQILWLFLMGWGGFYVISGHYHHPPKFPKQSINC